MTGVTTRIITCAAAFVASARIRPSIAVSATRAQLLVTLSVDPGWHVSWRNPGETGLPTRLTWSLPAGVRVLHETWPVPVIAHTPVGATHTLEGVVPWLVEFQIDSATAIDRLVTLTLRYGVCRDVCIPEQLAVQGVLPGQTGAKLAVVSPALRTRLATDGGRIAARRRGTTELCLSGLPPVRWSAIPEVVADSGLGLDAALPLMPVARRGQRAFIVAVPTDTRLPDGTHVLFVRGTQGVAAQLDFRRPAPGCAAR
jgi:Disulphide bond corrector protein DsbC